MSSYTFFVILLVKSSSQTTNSNSSSSQISNSTLCTTGGADLGNLLQGGEAYNTKCGGGIFNLHDSPLLFLSSSAYCTSKE